MKISQLSITLFIVLSFAFISSAYSWSNSAGEPLYADALVSGDSGYGWINGPVSICTGWTVYFKAQGPGGTDLPIYDLDYYQGNVIGDNIEYYWDFGDNASHTGSNVSHTFNTLGLFYSVLSVDDYHYYYYDYDDSPAIDTAYVYVCNVVNPHIDVPSQEKDLTYRLPYAGTFTFGTSGWLVSTTGGGSIISYTGSTEGWIGFRCSSAGGAATLSFTSSYFVNLSDPGTIMDELKLFIKFRLNYSAYTSMPAGTSFDVLLYGDNSTNNLPLELKSDFSGHSLIQIDNGFKEMSLCVTGIPQDFHRISNMVLRYTGGSGEASELQIDQIYLSASRVAQ
jgi:hypothetical protein